jgi:cytochrome b561
MEIKLKKHWHYLVAIIGVLCIGTIVEKIMGTAGNFIFSAMEGFAILILIVMWVSFASIKKDVPRNNND